MMRSTTRHKQADRIKIVWMDAFLGLRYPVDGLYLSVEINHKKTRSSTQECKIKYFYCEIVPLFFSPA